MMYIDHNGNFPILVTMIIVGALVGGGLGGYTAVKNDAELWSKQFWIGVGTGAFIGGSVAAVAGGGAGYLMGGLSSVGNKFISDVVSSSFYGTINFGSWEDYAVAFVIGGFIKGKDYSGVSKWFLDSVARPLLNQVTKIGTRGAKFNVGRFAYDVVTRTATMGIDKKTNVFGLELDPSKAMIRGWLSGLGKIIYD